jgi:hypothetical protein
MATGNRTAIVKIHKIPWAVPSAVAVPFSGIRISRIVDNVAITH